MLARALATTRRLIAHPRAPTVALALILALSLGARLFDLGQPCSTPCTGPTAHTLIFDEAYYVNAARIIAGIRPPAGSNYATAPLGKDPNAEHPQLAKLIMAAGIDLLGDGPWGWRLGSVIFGMIALIAMYALVRAARGSPWMAVGVTAVMATDNLMLIHSRIGTLDIYFVAMSIAAAALYLRERPLLAGIVLGIGACMKLVALELIPVLVLYEAFVVAWARGETPGVRQALRARAVPLAISVGMTIVVLLLGVWVMDLLVPAYDPGTRIVYNGDPFSHIAHMLNYAENLKAVANAVGISSTPWQWLLDRKPIDYATVAVNSLSNGKIIASKAIFDARGAINPFIIFLAVPALVSSAAAAWRRRDQLAALGVAWCLGTFLPLAFQAQVLDRISYLYYMLIVMPGVYIVVAQLMSPKRVGRAATIGWAIVLIYGVLNLYPVQSLSL